MADYQKLEVYQRAYKLAVEVYKFSLTLPKSLQHDVADDIRRASRSIPSNIAEGYGRNKSEKDKANLLGDALGSNDEILFNLKFLNDIQLINQSLYQRLFEEYTITGKQLFSLIRTIKKPDASN